MRTGEEIKVIEEVILNNLSLTKQGSGSAIPKFIYHFSDIENIISILTMGKLYSRSLCVNNGWMRNENANLEVIEKTDTNNYVRLYFRPKTPTQYHNEGIFSIKSDEKAKCQIPVFLLFDSVKLLSLKRSRFAESGLYKKPTVYDDVLELKRFDFEKIFHSGPINSEDKEEVKAKRHAEVLFEEELDLECLEYIICRSSAEKEYFIQLLNDNNLKHYSSLVKIDTKTIFFERRRFYIDKVFLTAKKIMLTFDNIGTLFTTYDKLIITIHSDGQSYSCDLPLEGPSVNVIFQSEFKSYTVDVKLNDKTIYYSEFNEYFNIPF